MREILFRAKRTDNEEWIEGYYATQSNHACFANALKYRHFIFKDVCLDFNLGGLQEFEVIPKTVGQYIGLTDKNGKKIFEGDIVGQYNVYEKQYSVGLVEYGEFNCSCCNGVYGWHFNNEDIRKHDTYEVLGNIFDNPELLGGDGE